MAPPKVLEVSLPSEVAAAAEDAGAQVEVRDTDSLSYTRHTYWLLALSILTDELCAAEETQKRAVAATGAAALGAGVE